MDTSWLVYNRMSIRHHLIEHIIDMLIRKRPVWNIRKNNGTLLLTCEIYLF